MYYEDMPDDKSREIRMELSLRPEVEIGILADFANVWNTPNTFVIDFLSVVQPTAPELTESGKDTGTDIVRAQVAARIRLPPEQIFMLSQALERQGKAWLEATGRTEPPQAWMTPGEGGESV